MSQNPLLSIITPSFNQGRFIEQTIRSVINQDYDNIEYIVIDGGSTDNTVDVIEKYKDKIDYWVSEPDDGQASAIVKGFAKANGDILAWLNSDDCYYSKDVFRKVADFFNSNPDVNICYGDNIYLDENNSILYLRKAPSFYSRKLLRIWNYIHQPTVFFRKKILEEFELNLKFHYTLDYDLWLRISTKYKFKYLNCLVSASRWHDSCKTVSNAQAFYDELEVAFAEIGKPFISRLIQPRHTARFFFNIQRLWSLPFLLQLNNQSGFGGAHVSSYTKLLKRQLFGLRFGG